MRLTLATRYIPISTSYNGNAKPGKREFAKELRKRQTTAEKILWKEVKARGFARYRIRRQHVVLGWIVDFYCIPEMLAIELDGGYHETTVSEDIRRDEIMANHGITVLRIANKDVLEDIVSVRRAIRDAIEQRRKRLGLSKSANLMIWYRDQ
jgi:very-short-patch-repair endonuclease